eukprot:scaffold18210_cov98-Isochrysis_galbana.AAC.2
MARVRCGGAGRRKAQSGGSPDTKTPAAFTSTASQQRPADQFKRHRRHQLGGVDRSPIRNPEGARHDGVHYLKRCVARSGRGWSGWV